MCVLFTPELIRELPKSDLHVHLDGSMREETLIEMAQKRGVKLPAETPEELRKTVFKARYRSLEEYLRGFAYTCAVLQDSDALERTAYELCVDCQEEGVRYVEIRFAPQLHTGEDRTILTVLSAVARGIERAERAFNSRPGVASGSEPPFHAGIIVCALRFFTPESSHTYAQMFRAFADLPERELFGLASKALVRASIRARDEYGLPVVGVDLAGQEHGYPAKDHVRAYQLAQEAFLGKTVHAGEDYGPESIFQAITECHADRIGHGTWLFNVDQIRDLRIVDRQAYVRRLVQYIADRRITVEVCLTSNLQTIPALRSLQDHPFKKMREARLSATFCTDNRLVSRTTVSREVELAVRAFNLGVKDLGDLLIYGFKRAFFPGPYLEKRAYVRQVIDYHDKVFARHGVEVNPNRNPAP
ncbi:adenosine deaminase family protein [Candidatus Bathyarchaeota archaeon]|nr:MAG: adenosine deaminase family protein [Candidatus Bathyarchaeota archaeon]